MGRIKVLLKLLSTLVLATLPAAAQLSSTPTDPLARIHEAAKTNAQACSATGESLCEQIAPKIIENAMGESPIPENLRRLNDEVNGDASAEATQRAIRWALTTFREAGLDVHTEKFTDHDGDPAERENVVAEIRGREKSDEWVLLGAHLGSQAIGAAKIDNSCDAAEIIEAARDISRTGIHPRRSIRFVLFAGDKRSGSWAYVREHRAELDRARAAIVFGSGCSRVTGFSLNGRHDTESGVREAMKPIESMGANHYAFITSRISDDFDFLVEGVPTLIANHQESKPLPGSRTASEASGNIEIKELKRNSAIAAVTAFGIAERAAPVGARQSRADIESLLKNSGLDKQMKTVGLWDRWESGKLGRIPD